MVVFFGGDHVKVLISVKSWSDITFNKRPLDSYAFPDLSYRGNMKKLAFIFTCKIIFKTGTIFCLTAPYVPKLWKKTPKRPFSFATTQI